MQLRWSTDPLSRSGNPPAAANVGSGYKTNMRPETTRNMLCNVTLVFQSKTLAIGIYRYDATTNFFLYSAITK